MNEIELVCFKMISTLGAARSAFMEAMVAAKKGNFEEAQSLIEEGQQQRLKGHEIHFELLQKDSSEKETSEAAWPAYPVSQISTVFMDADFEKENGFKNLSVEMSVDQGTPVYAMRD